MNACLELFPAPPAGRVTTLLAALVLATGGAAASAQDGDDGPPLPPLFTGPELLVLTLEADFDALDGDRGQESPERPAVLRWVDPSGTEQVQDLQVSTRGNFRLRRSTCRFPPIRLDLKKGAVQGTVFDGQDKLKLVTHCNEAERYEQNLLEEYVAYRIYGMLTDVSFQVRLVRISYVDTSGESGPLTRYAFMIEDDDAMAVRVGGHALEVPQAPPEALDDHAAARMAVFQYLIGNTDWSAVYGHNTQILRLSDGRHVAVPYDFDFSGLVDAPYAAPAPRIGIEDVRDRIYRGFCRDELDLEPVYAEFGRIEQDVYHLVRTVQGMSDDTRETAIRYVSDFFEILGSERLRRREIEEACRRS